MWSSWEILRTRLLHGVFKHWGLGKPIWASCLSHVFLSQILTLFSKLVNLDFIVRVSLVKFWIRVLWFFLRRFLLSLLRLCLFWLLNNLLVLLNGLFDSVLGHQVLHRQLLVRERARLVHFDPSFDFYFFIEVPINRTDRVVNNLLGKGTSEGFS